MMKLRSDPPAGAALPRWLDELRFVYAACIIPVDDAVAVVWGRLMAQCTRPAINALIAATAYVHNKVAVTRNIVDFGATGVR